MLLPLMLLLLSPVVYSHSSSDSPSRILIRITDSPAVKKYLRAHEYDVAGIDWRRGELEVLASPEEIAELKNQNFNVVYELSQTLLRNPDPEYLNPTKVEEALKRFHSTYPDLTQIKSIGKSLEGRDIWALKISSNPLMSKPAILFNSMHHAREIMTPEVGIDIIEYLLTRYSSDSQVQTWLNTTDVWVIPMFNVDGNNRMWTKDSMWRKNTRNGHGVDLNRNYPGTWNTCNGSSGMTFSQTYRGPSAGSEPETQVMMSFVKEIRPVFNISYHAFSELVLYPFGCKPGKAQQVVEAIGKEMGRLLDYKAGTPWELLYNADGGDIDWMFQEMQVIPFVIELNSSSQGGFHPDYREWRDVTVEKNRLGWQYLLKRMQGPALVGKIKSTDVVVEVRNAKNELVTEYRVNPDGSYFIVLDQGQYSVKFKTKDTVLEKKSVSLSAANLTLQHLF
ncbi:MAG: M14 family metallopeptidase [Proteobacteria bacterium]|nr:M14 family metallopeptidase [Pseudomonadota bacterium]